MKNQRLNFWLILFVIICLEACTTSNQNNFNYFDLQPPGAIPEVFAKDFISKENRWEGNFNYSPDGKEIYFNVYIDTIKYIYWSQHVDGQWNEPAPLEAIGNYNNWEPFITRDGMELYFVSSRPPGSPEWDGRLWKSNREGDNWSKPEIVDLSNYHPKFGLWYPNQANKNELYFGAIIEQLDNKNKGQGEMYYFDKTNQTVHHLGNLNSPKEDWDPYIAPDGSYILWASDRDGGYGGTDLYVSFRTSEDEAWGNPINLGDAINTPDYEVAPRLSLDGKYLFFDRPIKGTQDIYWVSTAVIEKLRPR